MIATITIVEPRRAFFDRVDRMAGTLVEIRRTTGLNGVY
jgi:hypothetical protein